MSVKLTGSKINDLIIGNLEFNSVLIYGNDESLINYRSWKLSQKYKKLKYEVVKIDCKGNQNPKSTILNEVESIDFFSSNKLIIIENITDKIFASISQNIENNTSCKFIFNIYEIAKCPKIRDFHEKSQGNFASIACYPLEEQDIISQIQLFLRDNSIKIEDQNLLSLLAQVIGQNPFDIEAELEKILILTNHTKLLDYNTILTIGNSNEISVFEFINYFFVKDISKITEYATNLIASEVNSVMLSRMLYKYCCKIINAVENIEQGSDKASEAKKAGIFFKNINIFYKHIDIWTIPQLNKLIIKILEFDKTTRLSQNDNILPNILNLLRI